MMRKKKNEPTAGNFSKPSCAPRIIHIFTFSLQRIKNGVFCCGTAETYVRTRVSYRVKGPRRNKKKCFMTISIAAEVRERETMEKSRTKGEETFARALISRRGGLIFS